VVLGIGRRHVVVGGSHGADMPDGEALPGDVGADQRGVNVDDSALGDAGRGAGLNRPLEDMPEALGAPALADAGQRRVVGQPLVQAGAGEPADRKVHLVAD
jgi:hypothetical protein